MPRNIQTFLPDGTLEGVRIIELSESNIKAFVVPRIKLGDIKDRPEISQPALYFLINSGDNQLYIGESENFFNRIKNHDQSKDFWDVAIAVVSNTNVLEKSDVKYLESFAVEKAKASAAMEVLNKTTPARNNVHEFKIHTLHKFLDDTALVAELLGYSVFATKTTTSEENAWYLNTKNTSAKAEYRGSKLIMLAGSKIDPEYSKRWAEKFPSQYVERTTILQESADLIDGVYVLNQSIPFNSPSHASRFATGRNSNGWAEWKDFSGKTMDDIVRKSAVSPFDVVMNSHSNPRDITEGRSA